MVGVIALLVVILAGAIIFAGIAITKGLQGKIKNPIRSNDQRKLDDINAAMVSIELQRNRMDANDPKHQVLDTYYELLIDERDRIIEGRSERSYHSVEKTVRKVLELE